MKKEVVILVVSLLCSSCSYQETGSMTVVFFDVGQGDSALIITAEGKKILVDCGKDANAEKYLKMMNITRIDALVITHPDTDHSGGCSYVKKSINVMRTFTNKNVRRDFQLYKGIRIITAYDTHKRFRKDNDNSILIKAVHEKTSFLFTGDCEAECEKEIMKTEDLKADVLKVSHHGSKYSTSLEFLEKVNPSAAVISAGENDYGHPHNETLARLANITILRTDINGTIVIAVNNQGYFIS